jgi:uncharacterized delta-60 repeat protein
MNAGNADVIQLSFPCALDPLEPRRLLSGGAFDPSFGTSGVVTQDFAGATRDVAADVAVQKDGRVIVVGNVYGGAVGRTNPDFTIARFDARGRLDRRFGGGDGVVTTDIASTHDAAFKVLIQPDGKFLVFGTADGALAIARYHANGALDPSFGHGGKLVVASIHGWIKGAGFLSDGALVVGAGNHVVRVSADGAETRRLTTQDWSDFGFHEIDHLVVQPDGRILLSGRYEFMEETEWGEITYDQALQVTRLMSDGTLDRSFADGGSFRAPPTENRKFPLGGMMALQPDGTIVVVGGLRVTRLRNDGTPDPSFGDGGVVRHELLEWNNITSAAVTSNGRIILGGRVLPYRQDADSLLVMLRPDGSLDTKFSRDGILADGSLSRDDEIHALAIAAGGRIVAAGAIYDAQYRHSDFLVARYERDGRYDRSFGRRGKATVGFTGSLEERLTKMVLQPDGKIILAGMSGDDAMLVRYLRDGSLDPSFGKEGLFRGSFAQPWTPGRASIDADEVLDVVLMDDGRLLALLADFVVIRLTTDGELDPSFGNGGVARAAPGDWDQRATAFAVMADGAFVVVGSAFDGHAGYFAAARFTRDGMADVAFGDGGVALIRSDGGWPEHVAVQQDGKIVLVEHVTANAAPAIVTLARLLPNGALDPSFGVNGIAQPPAPEWHYSWGRRLHIDAEGRLIVEAMRDAFWNGRTVLLRFLPDGTFDASYGSGGSWRPPDYFPVRDPILLPDGATLGAWDRGVVRFRADGTRDSSFGENGLLRLIASNDSSSHFQFAALDADGTILLAGTRRSPGGGLDLLLARVVLDPAAQSSLHETRTSRPGRRSAARSAWTSTSSHAAPKTAPAMTSLGQ